MAHSGYLGRMSARLRKFIALWAILGFMCREIEKDGDKASGAARKALYQRAVNLFESAPADQWHDTYLQLVGKGAFDVAGCKAKLAKS